MEMHRLPRQFLRRHLPVPLAIRPELPADHCLNFKWPTRHSSHQPSRQFAAKRHLDLSRTQLARPSPPDAAPKAKPPHPTEEALAKAFAQYSEGETTQAVATLSKSLPQQTVVIGSLLNAAACCLKLGDYRRAADYALAAVVIDPGNDIAWFRAISALRSDGLEREAVGLVRMAPVNVQKKAHRLFTGTQLESIDHGADPFAAFQTRTADGPVSPQG